MIGSHFSHFYARWPPPTAVVQELEVAAAMDLHVQQGDNDNNNGDNDNDNDKNDNDNDNGPPLICDMLIC